jgi:DNA-binding GntR family transcriptional regulator
MYSPAMVSARDGTPAAARGDSVRTATDGIRSLITRRELLPGQQLRQDDLAARLGCSRGPTREALQALRQEGIVSHAKNRGYVVARFEFDELKQLNRLRDLIESELLRSLPKPTVKQVARLRSLNKQMARATDAQEFIQCHQAFHFGIFKLSPLTLITREADRLWKMTAAYRALVVVGTTVQLPVLADAHDAMLDAFADHTVEKLVKLYLEYRASGLDGLRMMVN